MVGIISGNGLGLFDSSNDRLGLNIGQSNLGQAKGQDYVNIATGNLSIQFLDKTLSAVGPDNQGLRTYNSQGSLTDGDADGWRWVGEKRLTLSGSLNSAGSTVTRTLGDGSQTVFSWNGSIYVSTAGDGANDTIGWSGTDWVYKLDGSDTHLERYDATTGWIKNIRELSGSYGYNFTFSGDKLQSIVDFISGQTLQFTYGGNGKLARLETRLTAGGVVTQQVYYNYDSSLRLSSVTTDLTPDDNSISDNNVYTTSYTYDGTSNRIASISQSDGTSASFTYTLIGGVYRVQTVTDQTGTSTFSYDTINRVTTVSNGLGNSWAYTYDASGQLTKQSATAVNGVSQSAQYAWDGVGNLKTLTDGRGNVISYSYDSNNNRTKEVDALGNTITRTFDSLNHLVTETRYTVPSVTSPSGSETTRYVYDIYSRLRYVVSAEGRVNETRYNQALSLISQSIQYAGGVYNLNGLSDTTALTEAQLNTWVSSQDKTKTQLTEFSYDYRGNLSKKTQYGAVDTSGTGVVLIDANGISVLDRSAEVTEYIYSQYGQLLQVIADRAPLRTTKTTLSSVVYDGLGRQISLVNGAGTTTTTTYSGTQITGSDNPSGLTVVTATDSLGRLTSLASSGSGTNRITKYYYDNAGQLKVSEDPTGVRSYLFYDAAGRVNYKVDAAGDAVGYTYDADGRVLTETQYATPLNAATLTGWGTTPPATLTVTTDAANDRVKTNTYDVAGRLKTVTQLDVATITYYYDGESRLTQTNQGDRNTYFYYDKDGRQIGQLNAENNLSENIYDGVGRLIKTVRYKNLVSTISDFATMKAAVSSGDKLTTYTYYDSEGRKTGFVNEQGFLTETQYDAAYNFKKDIQYFNPLSVLDSSTLSSLKPVAGTSVFINIGFDAVGRTESITAIDGSITRYSYGADSKLARIVEAEGTSEQRATRKAYNAFGELIGEVSGVGESTITAPSTQTISTAINNYGVRYDIDGAGRKIAEYHPNGQKTYLFYNTAGQLTYTLNAQGEVARVNYNAFGEVVIARVFSNRLSSSDMTSVNKGGIDTAIKSLVLGDVTDKITTTSYSRFAQISSQLDAENNTTTNSYNVFGELSNIRRYINSNPIVSTQNQFNRDKLGRITSTIVDADTGGYQLQTQTIYDGLGRIKQTIDANGNVTNISYVNSDGTVTGRTITTTDALGYTKKIETDARGRTLKSYDGLGNLTQYTYDDVNRTVVVIQADGTQIKTWKSRTGDTLQIQDANGGITKYVYTADGQLDTVTNALNVVITDNDYDASGRVYQSKDGNGVITSYSYDTADRLVTKSVDPSGLNIQTTYQFDGQGRKIYVTEGANTSAASTTQYIYDRKGQVTQTIVDPNGLQLSTKFTYDGIGETVQVDKGTLSNPSQQTIKYTYDKAGRKTTEQIDPNGLNITTQFKYDNNGNVTKKIDANGNSTWFTYDANNRLTYTIDSLGAVTQNIYDANGHVVSTRQYAKKINQPNIGSTDNKTITLTGDYAGLKSATKITIDPNKSYTVRVKLRQLSGQGSVYAGVITYDSNGNEVTNPYSGTYSYCAGSMSITPDMGWVTLQGNITGIAAINASASYGNFLQGSVSAVPMILYNYYGDSSGDNGRVVEVDHLEFIDNATGTVLNANSNMAGGTSNWLASQFEGSYYGTDNILTDKQVKDLLHSDATNDRVTRYTYDAAGRLTYTVDSTGAVAQNIYDANGHVVSTRQYAKKINQPNIGSTDNKTITLTGDYGQLVNTTRITIDPNKSYTVRVKLRQLSGQGTVYAGVITYDANGNTISNPYAGSFSYCASTGQLLTPDMGWVTLQGTITGTTAISASSSYNAFLQGSSTAVPLLLYNYYGDSSGDNGRVVEVDHLEFIDNATGTVLNPNSSMAGGASNWSLSQLEGSYYGTDNILTDKQVKDLLHTDNGNDRVTRYTYDAAGRLTYTVDSTGAVTQNIYDANGHVVSTRQYAKKINLPNIGSTDNKTITLTGDYGQLVNTTRITIDPNKSYTVRVKLRQLSGQGTVYAGVITYDANGNTISNPYAGSFSYCASTGQLLTPDMGWVTLQGTITGTTAISASSSYNAFLQGSSTAVPMILYNYYGDSSGDNGRVVEVDHLEFIDNATGTVLNPNSSMAGGASNWSLSQLEGSYYGTDNILTDKQVKDLLHADNANDRVTRYTYDAAGRLQYAIDASGAVTENQYDAVGHVISTRQYANTVPTGNAMKMWYTGGSTNRSANHFLGTFKAGDVVTATVRFKSAPNTVAQVFLGDDGGADPYDNSVAKGMWGNDGWQTITVTRTMSHDDMMQIYVYGDVSGSSDTSHFVLYDNVRVTSAQQGEVFCDNFDKGIGNWSISGSAEVAVVSIADANTDALLKSFIPTLVDNQRDRITTYSYDAAGRLIYTVDALGEVTQNIYDANGHIVRKIDYANKTLLSNALLNNLSVKNILQNGSFGTLSSSLPDNWSFSNYITPSTRYGVDYSSNWMLPSSNNSEHTLFIEQSATASSAAYQDISQTINNIAAGQTYRFSAYTGAHRTTVYAIVEFYDAQGNKLSGSSPDANAQNANEMVGGTQLENYKKIFVEATAPQGAVSAKVILRKSNNTDPNNQSSYLLAAKTIFEAIPTVSASADRVTRYTYDAAGRLQYAVDPSGAVTENQYDAVGHVISTRQYANTVPTGNTMKMGYSSSLFNGASHYLGSFSTGDVVTATVRFKTSANTTAAMFLGDAGGPNPYDNSVYKTVVGNDGWVTITLTQTMTHDDLMSVYVYGDQGAAPDATHFIYYDNVRVSSNQKGEVFNDNFDNGLSNWATSGTAQIAVTSIADANTDALLKSFIPSLLDNQRDRITTYSYDAAGRLIYTVNALGALTETNYNTFGDLISSTQYSKGILVGMQGISGIVSYINGAFQGGFSDSTRDRMTTFSYDGLGRQIKTTLAGWYDDSRGRVFGSQTEVDSLAPSDTTTDRFQRTVEVTYDSFGNAVANKIRTGFSNYVYQYKTYDALGREVNDIDALGYVTQKTYDTFSNVKTQTRSANSVVVKTSGFWVNSDSALGNLSGRTITFDYDVIGRKTKVTLPAVSDGVAAAASPVTTYSYDTFSNVTKQSVLLTAGQTADTYFYYDQLGRNLLTVDSEQYGTQTIYDAFGNVTSLTEFANRTVSSLNTNNKPVFTSDSVNDRVSSYTYDALGKAKTLSARVKALSGTTTNQISSTNYNAFGEVINTTDALGNVTSVDYDAAGHARQITEVARQVASTGVDPFVGQVSATPTTVITYDAFGQRKSEVRSASSGRGASVTTSHIYDVAGNEVQTTDALTNLINKQYDTAGHLIRQTQAVSVSNAVYNYTDTVDNRFEYDVTGRQTAALEVVAGQVTGKKTVYNGFGEVAEEHMIQGAAGTTSGGGASYTLSKDVIAASYDYDAAGRMRAKHGSEGYNFFFYDWAGRMTRTEQHGSNSAGWGTSVSVGSASLSNRVTVIGYDKLNRVLNVALPQYSATGTLDTTKDALTQSVTPQTPTINKNYDRWGNLLGVSGATVTMNYTYNQSNQVLSQEGTYVYTTDTWGNSPAAKLRTEFQYDTNGRLITETQVSVAGAGGELGRRTSKTNSYNAAGQLLRTVNAAGDTMDYAYDINGNKVGTRNGMGRVTVDNFNANNQLMSHAVLRNGATNVYTNSYNSSTGQFAGVETSSPTAVVLTQYAFDQAGRQSTETDAANNVQYYKYDARGNLLEARNLVGNTKTYAYDAFGNKTQEGYLVGATNTPINQWSYDLVNNYTFGRQTTHWVGAVTYDFTYTGFGQLDKETDHANSAHYVKYDYWENGLLQKITETPNNLSNSTVSSYAYDNKGNRTAETNTSSVYYAPVSTTFYGTTYTTPAHTDTSSQTTLYQYDDLNRLTKVQSPAGNFGVNGISYQTSNLANLTTAYDIWGNRRNVSATYTLPGGSSTTKSEWYDYDAANRVIVEGGQITGGKVVISKTGGVSYEYDATGRRRNEQKWSKTLTTDVQTGIDSYGQPKYTPTPSGEQYTKSSYTYNDLDLTDSSSTTLINRALNADSSSNPVYTFATTLDVNNTYDNRGFKTLSVDRPADRSTTYDYRADGTISRQLATVISTNKLDNLKDSFSYDELGNVQSFKLTVYNSAGSISYTNMYNYAYTDTYSGRQNTLISVSSSQSGAIKGNTSNTYDGRGRLAAVSITEANSSGTVGTGFRYFAYSATGQIIGKVQQAYGDSTKTESYYYQSGNQLAELGQLSVDISPNMAVYTGGNTPSSYTVSGGDTLMRIAQLVFGDGNLWYLIADANGLVQGATDVLGANFVGRSLRIPNGEKALGNKAANYAPYNAREIIGNMIPALMRDNLANMAATALTAAEVTRKYTPKHPFVLTSDNQQEWIDMKIASGFYAAGDEVLTFLPSGGLGHRQTTLKAAKLQEAKYYDHYPTQTELRYQSLFGQSQKEAGNEIINPAAYKQFHKPPKVPELKHDEGKLPNQVQVNNYNEALAKYEKNYSTWQGKIDNFIKQGNSILDVKQPKSSPFVRVRDAIVDGAKYLGDHGATIGGNSDGQSASFNVNNSEIYNSNNSEMTFNYDPKANTQQVNFTQNAQYNQQSTTSSGVSQPTKAAAFSASVPELSDASTRVDFMASQSAAKIMASLPQFEIQDPDEVVVSKAPYTYVEQLMYDIDHPNIMFDPNYRAPSSQFQPAKPSNTLLSQFGPYRKEYKFGSNSVTRTAQAASSNLVDYSQGFTKDYDSMLSSYGDLKDWIRKNNDEMGVRGSGGAWTVLAASTHAASELGFGILDMGFSLGRLIALTGDSLDRGTATQDFNDYVWNPVKNFGSSALDMDVFRFSAGGKLTLNGTKTGEDFKVFIGTDRVGSQYKVDNNALERTSFPSNQFNEVVRYSHPWGGEGMQTEIMFERNFNESLAISRVYDGNEFRIALVPGLRYNATRRNTATPSWNLELNVGGKKSVIPYEFKFTFEMRKKGS